MLPHGQKRRKGYGCHAHHVSIWLAFGIIVIICHRPLRVTASAHQFRDIMRWVTSQPTADGTAMVKECNLSRGVRWARLSVNCCRISTMTHYRALGGQPSRARLDEQHRMALPWVLEKIEAYA